jgi:hypothetical protein
MLEAILTLKVQKQLSAGYAEGYPHALAALSARKQVLNNK